MMRFAINGFGRVGRTLLRVYRTREDAQARFELAAINEIADANTVAHLARYDSNYGRYPGRIALSGSLLAIDHSLVPLSHEPDVAALPWGELGIDLVHFGVLIVVNSMIGLITPPYGILLFVINAVTGIPLKEIIREIWAFLFVLIGALLLMILVPDIVLWLPRLFGYQG